MDYSVFDPLLDSIFVVNEDHSVSYCNETAATLCDSSVKRMTRGKKIEEFIQFDNNLLNQLLDPDNISSGQIIEAGYQAGNTKTGKAQVKSQIFTEEGGSRRWILVIREVTLEEVLHGKYRAQLEQKEKVIAELEVARSQLEDYSRNLEKMVEVRTSELKNANRTLNAIMNSLGQGFLTFDREGLCGEVYTRACEDILEAVPNGHYIWEVLGLEGGQKAQFQMWLRAIFDQSLPFESLKGLGPSLYHHSRGRYITLDYYLIPNESSESSYLVLVATDQTSEYEANIALNREKQNARMIMKTVQSKQQFAQFLLGVEEGINELKMSSSKSEGLDIEYAFRLLHTLEGEAGAFFAEPILVACRVAQESIEPLRNIEGRVPTDQLGMFRQGLIDLENAYKDFCKTHRDLFELTGVTGRRRIEIDDDILEDFLSQLKNEGVAAKTIQSFKDGLSKQTVQMLMRHYFDLAHMVAQKQNKRLAPVELDGGDLVVSSARLEKLISSFVHAFRNAVDHGIEPADERQFLGKSEEGHLKVIWQRSLVKNKPWLKIQIQDDGRGIDSDEMYKKLISKNIVSTNDSLSEEEILQFVFHSGFSSRDAVGEFSGRGVGMEAIAYEARALGGQVHFSSQKGEGSLLTIDVPEASSVGQIMKVSA